MVGCEGLICLESLLQGLEWSWGWVCGAGAPLSSLGAECKIQGRSQLGSRVPGRQVSTHTSWSLWACPGPVNPAPGHFCPAFWPCPSFLLSLVLRSGTRNGVGTSAGPLAPLLAELKLIHGPHSPLFTLHSHKTLVQAQVVADGILWKEDQLVRLGIGGVDGQPSSEVSSPHQKPTSCPFPSHLQAQPQAFPAWPSTVVALEAILACPPPEALTFQVAG